jgi:prevent-host-death family protein
MKELTVREMRANIGRLDQLVEEAGELIISRRGKPIARVLPVSGQRQRPDHSDLRAKTGVLTTSSADLIRAERDER